MPHLVFAYFGGHGATLNEKQLFLLNASESKHVSITAEVKLRRLALDDEFKCAHVWCVFDCCRVPLENMRGLQQGKGIGYSEFDYDTPEFDPQ